MLTIIKPVILILIVSWIVFILCVALQRPVGIREDVQEKSTVELSESTEPEEYIDFTEVMLDKRTFMCRGDVDLNVNEIGVVTFTCDTEDEKLTFTLNPVEMFVTRHWAKRGVNDMGTAEEESE
jgi:hypothetical protein